MKREQEPVTAVVARNVRHLRNACDWSARALAERITQTGRHCTREMIANLESGYVSELGVDQLFAFANALGVEPWALTDPTPPCTTCSGKPPTGFTCNDCGKAGKK